MDNANEDSKEAIPGLPTIPPLHTPTPPTPQDAYILGLNKTSGMSGTVFETLFQNFVCQDDKDERGGGLKDGYKRRKYLE